MTELGELSLGYSLLEWASDGSARLRASRCPDCGDVRIPPRAFCVNDSTSCQEISLSGGGTIYEAVRIQIPPDGFDGPFWAGYIDLDEGPRFFAQIACSDGETRPEHGARVQMAVHDIGIAERSLLAPVFVRVVS